MMSATSRDGTTIAYDSSGEGPPLILVDGALMSRRAESKPELVTLLAHHFTVYNYDRRGRGDSGDTQPYSVEREIEDIDALIEHAGGQAYLYGVSSGGCLALEAARVLGRDRVAAVTVYEAPWNDDPAAQEAWAAYVTGLKEALASGRRGDALALFMEYVGTPADQVAGMRQAPFWPSLEALAPTLAYDHTGAMGASVSVPRQWLAELGVPVLAVCGAASHSFMCATAKTIAEAVPQGSWRTLQGQTHAVEPGAVAPLLIEFFTTKAKDTRAA